MKINIKKFIARISELIVIVGSIILTPMAIEYANNWRGYKAFGGEYLIPVLGLLIAMVIETIYEESERNKKKNKGGKHAR